MDSNENRGEIIVYQSKDGISRVDVRMANDTVWLSLDQLSQLYGRNKSTISRHLNNIFAEGELNRNSVVANYATTAADGKTYRVDYYNLDVIIAVGYRVRSSVGTQFRQWATALLKEYMQKGFTLDDERLKGNGGGDYWKELLARIRDIRSSEKVMYRQVLDLYATSVDYDPRSAESIRFFQIVQNKLHYAAHGHTAAEVIYERADADKPFMGLRTFSGDMPVKNPLFTTPPELLSRHYIFVQHPLTNGFSRRIIMSHSTNAVVRKQYMKLDMASILIKKSALHFDKMANGVLAQYGLTVSQYKVIKYLNMEAESGIRITDLGTYFSMAHPTVIGIVQNLEKKGLVTYAPNPNDARSRFIALTALAMERREEWEAGGAKMEKELTDALTEKERKQLVLLLRKMLRISEDE